MSFLHELYPQQLLLFALVLARIGALVAVAPVFGSAAVPWRFRGALAVVLALFVTPLEAGKATELPGNMADFLVLAGADALIGLILGLGVLVLFSGLQVAGQLISQMSGTQLGDVLDPGLGASVPTVSRLLYYVTLAVFLAIGGHRQVLAALLDTFVSLPAGQGASSPAFTAAITSVLAQSFELGIRVAAPAVVALLLTTLVLGMVARTLPQLNIIALGFGLNSMVTFVALGVSLGAVAWLFQDQLTPMLETVLIAVRG
jgi:flagellar biosynthetic protein FliR